VWFWPKIYVNFSFQDLFIFSMSWFYIFHLSNSSHIFMLASCSSSRVLLNSSHTLSLHDYHFVLTLGLLILFLFFILWFVILPFCASFECFFSSHLYYFFCNISLNLIVYCLISGFRDVQRVELFIISWHEFTPNQTIIWPNRNSKCKEVGWHIETVNCFGWTIFIPNSTKFDCCPPLPSATQPLKINY
jgi:hypothetical protein